MFYDAVSLEVGQQFDTDFMQGLSNSLIVTPFITVPALQRMLTTGSQASVDNVLLEWWLSLTLMKAAKGRLRAVVPIFCGNVSGGTQGVR